MKFFCAIVLLFIASAVSAVKDDDMWNFYKASYGKSHHPKEEAGRRANFIARQRMIEKHNRENKGWQMGHNKFSDMSDSERRALLGVKPQLITSDMDLDVAVSPIEERALPASIDYRTDTCMQAVKDQGQCGSCWSFATITPLEFNYCKKNGGSAVALSEQMLVDCDPYDNGCNGGFYTNAWKYIKEKGGAMKASAYSYSSGTTTVAGTTCKFDAAAVGPKVSAYSMTQASGSTNNTIIMTYLQSDGPLPAAIRIIDSFYNYAGGVFSDPACKLTDYTLIDHAVVIVGYGTTTATSTVPATPYWIVRNSWSTGWGLGGYFLIKRGENMCNIEAWTAYVRV